MNLELSRLSLSIITVCFNAARDIEMTIKSVIPFINNKVEYIIIDGGSTDGTLDVIRKYSDKISVFVSEKDSGIYDAMNKGLRMANGKWAIFINCGDLLLRIPDKIYSDEYLGYDCAIAPVQVNNGKVIIPRVSVLMYIKNTIPHQGLFYNIYKQRVSFDTKYKIFADHDLNLKLYRKGCHYLILNEVVAYHSLDGISSDKKRASKEMFMLRRDHGGCLLEVLSFVYYKFEGLKQRIAKLFNRN